MNEPSSTPPSSAPSPSDIDEKLRHLPPAACDAFRKFQADGDVAGLDVLIFAILENYIPRKKEKPLAEFPADSKLIEDLGFDSLAITELVFFTEDLFGISIANEEILQVRTIEDLRTFVRRKVTERKSAA